MSHPEPLAAGCALDGAVAKRLGWTEVAPAIRCTESDWHWYGTSPAGRTRRIPPYSTDWAAMGALVAHLVGQGWTVDLEVFSDHTEAMVYRLEPDVAHCCFAPGAPAALCLAALQTVGG